MRYFENILKPEHHNLLLELISSSDFPWYFFPKTSNDNNPEAIFMDNSVVDNYQFCHSIVDNTNITSDSYDNLSQILGFMANNYGGTYKIKRIKCNLLLQNRTFKLDNYNIPHVDSYSNTSKTLLYYVNDSDGDTFMFNERYNTTFDNLTIERRITPKQNSAIVFDSNQFHASSPPRNNTTRIVINFVFDF